mmetsp:Transcript_3751/g.7798  ORF Transcript_3751/g.7798 Transcript_3751/m.7798 type:complete len:532 (-) Transcript_3751:227-1822(-)
MGNQSSTNSSSHIDIDRLRHFSRNGNSLGLSRAELDKRCQPSGLYAGCDWEKNAIRRLIGDGRIAARQKGLESPDTSTGYTEECPICFLYYSEVNKTNCCHACMCTECYLQVRPQKEKTSTCSFCNCDDFSVSLKKKKDAPEEKCPSEVSTSGSDTSGSSSDEKPKKKSGASVAPHTPPQTPKASVRNGSFGSELEKDERYQRMRKRSESFASSDGNTTPKKEKEIIQSVAMTPEERQRLEEEMKAQHFHPLILRLDNEAQERALENDRAYQNSARGQQASASRNQHLSRRVRTARNWEQITNFFDQGEEMDGVGALESAILYSRLAEASREGAGNENRAAGNNADNSDGDNNRGQLEGFPLLRTLLTGQIDSHQSGRSMRSSRRQRHQFMRSGLGSLAVRHRGMGDVAMGTASLMMRGISEEEQINMAIAASMRDHENPENAETDEEESNADDETNEVDDENADTSEDSSSDNQAEMTDDAESNVAEEEEEPQMKVPGSGDEASTITELARVVTDTRSPDADTILNGIAA